MTARVKPITRKRAASWPTKAASMNIVWTTSGQAMNNAPVPKYSSPFPTVYFDAVDKLPGFSRRSVMKDISHYLTCEQNLILSRPHALAGSATSSATHPDDSDKSAALNIVKSNRLQPVILPVACVVARA